MLPAVSVSATFVQNKKLQRERYNRLQQKFNIVFSFHWRENFLYVRNTLVYKFLDLIRSNNETLLI